MRVKETSIVPWILVSVLVILFVVYFIYQQRKVGEMRRIVEMKDKEEISGKESEETMGVDD